jgi:hypothetical protein
LLVIFISGVYLFSLVERWVALEGLGLLGLGAESIELGRGLR